MLNKNFVDLKESDKLGMHNFSKTIDKIHSTNPKMHLFYMSQCSIQFLLMNSQTMLVIKW